MRTVFNCCYIELHLKCDRAARSDSETWINLDQGKKVFHPPFPSLKSAKKRTRTMCQIYSKLTIKTPERRLVFLLLTLKIPRFVLLLLLLNL